jgi:hypothetical protein
MPSSRTLPRRPPRSWLAHALVAALVLHAAAFLLVRFPAERGRHAGGPLVLEPRPSEVESAAADRMLAPLQAPVATDGRRAEDDSAAKRDVETPIPVIRESPVAAEETTIPSTALTEVRGATLPLVVSPGGGIARRRLERTPEQIAIARAESLLVARMAGIAVVEERDIGAIGLANGGITLAIPWQGFLPADRRDGAWRKERCSEDGDGESDKAGEGEARRAQCG